MDKICIIAAKRTPQGRFLGGLEKYSAIELAIFAAKEVLKEADVNDIDQVILGKCDNGRSRDESSKTDRSGCWYSNR